MRRLLGSIVAACTLLAAALAQPPSLRRADPADEALMRGAYIEAIDRWRAAAFPAEGPADESALAVWRQVHPFIGGVHDPAAMRREPAGPLDPEVVERYRRAEIRGALREIRTRAAQTRIVILNEAHDSPRDRGFALEVARALRPLGYRLLAAETFSNRDEPETAAQRMERLARDGFPRLSTGHYTTDPIFGDFVRRSLALGYRPIAYESTTHRADLGPAEQLAAREQEQAENLARQIRANPGARILVYVGYSHAIETPFPDGAGGTMEWMASRLKRLTGVDPLTIDQTLIDETVPRHRAYRDLVAPRMGRRPVVLFLGGRALIEGRPPGAHDLQVIHPPLRLVRGRPDWLWRIGRRPVRVPRSLLPRSGRRLIQAFAAGEPRDAIPLDQIVAEAGHPPPPLLVQRGRIRWAFQDPVPLR